MYWNTHSRSLNLADDRGTLFLSFDRKSERRIGRGERRGHRISVATTECALMARSSPDGREGRGPVSDHWSTGYEPFAAEHHRHDPPAESVEEQQRRGEADGEGERRVDHVERDE